MQADVLEQVELLQNGTLTVSRQTSTGTVIKMPAGIRERADLASYAKEVAELSYRALGDAAPSRAEGASSPNSSYNPITIVLPQANALPRSARGEAVIELQR